MLFASFQALNHSMAMPFFISSSSITSQALGMSNITDLAVAPDFLVKDVIADSEELSSSEVSKLFRLRMPFLLLLTDLVAVLKPMEEASSFSLSLSTIC